MSGGLCCIEVPHVVGHNFAFANSWLVRCVAFLTPLIAMSTQDKTHSRFPVYVVCQWIDNSLPVAAKHYLQVTDKYYGEAVRPEAAQQPHAADRTLSHKCWRTSVNADDCDEVLCGASEKIGPEGFEPPNKGL